MLENVKSQYLVKLLFTFLLHKRKLRIVRYNKQLQKKLDINLIFYKNMTNKYIIYEGKGIGKEYDLEGKLLFKGQYYNGERNGNGEEYYYSELFIKENLRMERGMDMEKKIVLIKHLKENSKMENIGMEFTKKEIMILMRKDILQY